MDQSTSEIAITLAILERGVFWIERIITITLTCLWIHSYFYFFSYSRESIIFDRAASVSADFFLFTNTFILMCLFIRSFLDLDPPHFRDPQDEDIKRLLSIERYAFCIERSGMVLLRILYLPLGLTYVQFLHISRASCIVLFPVANILYSENFIFGCLKEKGDSYEKCSGGANEIVDERDQDTGHQPEEKDDTSPLMPSFCCRTCAEEARTETEKYNEFSCMTTVDELAAETQDYENTVEGLGTETQDYDGRSDTSGIEELGIETQEYDDNLELDEDIPDLEEVEETKEEADTFSEVSFELLNMQDNKMRERIQELDQELRTDKQNYQKMVRFEALNIQVHQMRRGIKELEKQLATAKQKYLTKLTKVENKCARKLKKVAEKYEEERKIWEEQKFDLISRLSATASQAEFYFVQAQDREENHRKLEEEVNDLIIKLSAANASSEVYRSLLHDDLRSALQN